VRVARARLILAGALALGVALIASLAAQPGSVPSAPARAAAADCAWQQHSKRMVKKVRRHGKLRRVVRWRRWWTCEPLAAAPAPAAPAPASPTPPAPEPEAEANRLSVTAREFYFVLSRPKVKAGSLPVELNNQGADAHNLNLRLEGDNGTPRELPETAPEQRSVASFDLPAGKYRLWCSLPAHDEEGMHATLLVE
jgi:plastocyanin